MSERRGISQEVIAEVVKKSRRRCCICYYLKSDLSEKSGQIAHLDKNPLNNSIDNLVFLCLDHHDKYDSKTSQSKGLTLLEVKHYREELYAVLSKKGIPEKEKATNIHIAVPVSRNKKANIIIVVISTIASLITIFVFVTGINYIGQIIYPSTKTPTNITPTKTIIIDTPTNTPTVTLTNTITPTITPTYVTGVDIESSCLYYKNWTPSDDTADKSVNTRGCYDKLSTWGFIAGPISQIVPNATPEKTQNGLNIKYFNDSKLNLLHGLYTRIPGKDVPNFMISFNFIIIQLTGDPDIADPNLVFGLGLPSEPLRNGNYYFARIFKSPYKIWNLVGDSISSSGYCPFYEDRKCYYMNPQNIVFDVRGNSVSILINEVNFRTLTITDRSNSVFWIGFYLPPDGSISAFLWNIMFI